MKFCHTSPTLQKYFWPTPGHKCSRQIFGRANDFYPKIAKLARKFAVTFAQEYLEFLDIPAFAKNFSPIMNPFWCDLQKMDPCVFLQTLGTIFWSQTTLGAIFARIFRAFNKSKHLGVRFHPLHHRFLHHSPWKIHFWPLPGKNPSGAHVYGYMLIYRNAEGVHGQRKFGNTWSIAWRPAFRLIRERE